MAHINPYINFNGNAFEAFNFYKSVFGGEFKIVVYFKDMASGDFSVNEEDKNKIMHIAFPIGNNILIGNDVPERMGKVNENENRSKILVEVESLQEATTLFNGLAVGGKIEVSLGESPWGSHFAMLRDKYGIEWMIEYDSKNNV